PAFCISLSNYSRFNPQLLLDLISTAGEFFVWPDS
ncbi:glutamine amidotransferase domain protein, partial [Chlamydia psittaci 02DC22]